MNTGPWHDPRMHPECGDLVDHYGLPSCDIDEYHSGEDMCLFDATKQAAGKKNRR